MTRNYRRRNGFSLLEILLAISILGGSLAVLSQMAEIGTSAAREARDLATCRILCQSKLTEVLLDASSGISPQSIFDAPLESFDSASITSYNHSIEVQQAPLDGLLAVRVTVKALESDDGTAIATVSLTRWVVDPSLGLEQAEADEKVLREEMTGGGEL
jgi:general secretion pathway protein I